MAHPSNSSVQQLAERYLLSALEITLPATFVDGAVLPIALTVKPDGIDLDRKIVVETFARIGRLKAAQKHKVKGDLLKLAYIRQQLGPDWRAVFCFADAEAASSTLGKGWHAQAARAFEIEIVVVDLPEDVRSEILWAQIAQRMVNA